MKKSGNRIACSPERMKIEEHVNKELKSLELSQEEYISVCGSLKECVIREEDSDAFSLHCSKMLPCSACRKNSFAIDVNGNIYKCRWIPGNASEHVIANVHDFNGTFLQRETTGFFLNYTIPDRAECLSCKLLPVCKGRCALNATVPGRYSCHRMLKEIDWAVLKLYNDMRYKR